MDFRGADHLVFQKGVVVVQGGALLCLWLAPAPCCGRLRRAVVALLRCLLGLIFSHLKACQASFPMTWRLARLDLR